MKVFSRFKFTSRAVHEVEELQEGHDEHDDDDEDENRRNTNTYPMAMTEEGSLCTSLTVWRKSLVINCKGFTVIDSCGNLVYRVDNYIVHPHELILMDTSGKCVLTMRRRRKLGLVDSWYVYEGEMGNKSTRMSELGESRESPVCCVRKRVNILQGNPKVQAYVYRTGSDSSDKRHAAFTVEGSYAHRTCKVLDESKSVVAEIKRKETISKDASFGIEIFQLIVQPGFDPAFAMALVLLLDQMFS